MLNSILKVFGFELINHNKGIEIISAIDGSWFNVVINYYPKQDECRLVVKKRGIHNSHYVKYDKLLVLESELNDLLGKILSEDVEIIIKELRFKAHS